MSLESTSPEHLYQLSNAFHLYSSGNPQQVQAELEKILASLKQDIFCLFDRSGHHLQHSPTSYPIFETLAAKIQEAYGPSCSKFARQFISQTLESFREEWKILSKVLEVPNIWSEGMQTAESCLCQDDSFGFKKEFCYRCNKLYHPGCFWRPDEKREQLFECPFCFIRNCLPDRPVHSILFAGYFAPTSDKTTFSFSIQCPSQILQEYELELRSVRLDEKARFEFTWPEFCEVFIDEQQTGSFKPLPLNSPLKKRADHPIIIPSQYLLASNTFTLTQYRSPAATPSWHIVALCSVSQAHHTHITNSFSMKMTSHESSRRYLQQLLAREDQQLSVDGIRILNKCQFYGTPIIRPARSLMCGGHFQPFDIASLVYSSIKAKCSPKKWKCPICGARAYDLRLDLFLCQLLIQNPTASEIHLRRNLPPLIHLQEPDMDPSIESSEEPLHLILEEDEPRSPIE